MNKLNRAAHEDRTLWTIAPLPSEEGAALVRVLTDECAARLSAPLAHARIAGASRTVALIRAGDTGASQRYPGLAAEAEARRSIPPERASGEAALMLVSHPEYASGGAARRTGLPGTEVTSADGTWLRLGCRTADGQQDILYLHFATKPPDEDTLQRNLAVWPALRNRCLDALSGLRHEDSQADGPDAALLWNVLSRIPAAVLVVNGAGLILRMNPQARRLIREGRVLTRGRGGLTASTDPGTRLLREAIRHCLNIHNSEQSLLLPTSDGNRIPATLFRFPVGGGADDLATLMIPVPPEPDQVERVARSLGLTATEARVASLLQRGMSNRVAAVAMGVQEQSFATYSKRVLSKLNVTSRAEIAQMLTWQSSLPSTEGVSS